MTFMALKRWMAVPFLVALLVASAPSAWAAAPGESEPPARAERLKAATIYGVTAGGLAVGGVTLWTVGAVLFPIVWALQRPLPPSVTLGTGWEHAGAFASIPFFATGTALWVASAGFAVMAVSQAALLR